MEIRLPDLREGYVHLVRTIREDGEPVTSRDMKTRELTGVTLRINSMGPLLPVGCGRKVNTMLAAVEALQLIGGVDARDALLRAQPRYGDVLVDPQDMAYGAYGPRVASQLPEIVNLLRMDPGTRQAVIEIWREEDLVHRGDKPCTLSLQFLLRGGELQLHTTMRSQDVWLGVPYDVFMFTQLQLTVARLLNIPSGVYVHHVASLHLYERDVEAAHALYYPENAISLPHGVAADIPLVRLNPVTPTAVMMTYVRNLLRNVQGSPADTTWREANPWYARQLEKVFTPATYAESVRVAQAGNGGYG